MPPIVDDAGQAISVKTDVSLQFRSEGTCETDAAAENQEHASPETSGAIPEGKPRDAWSCTTDKLKSHSSGQRLGKVCEDPTVDFAFVRDAWWA